MKTIKLFLILLFALNFSFAATITWDGGGGDQAWSTATNWDGDALPGTSDDVILNSGDVVSLSGLTTTIKSLSIDGNTILNIAATGDLTVDLSTGHSVAVTTGTITNDGTLTVTNPGDRCISLGTGTLTNNGTISVSGSGSSGLYGAGYFTNNSGAILNITSCYVGMTVTTSASNSGTINFTGGSIGLVAQNLFTNNGTLTFLNQTNIGIYTSTGSNFTNNATVDITNVTGGATGGGIHSRASFINNGGGEITISGCSPYGYNNYNAAGHLTNSGTLSVSSSGTVGIKKDIGSLTLNGTIQGDDTYELEGVSMGATLEPGNSPGTMNFTASQTFTGNINFELDGPSAGSQYDQVNVTSTATLTGIALNVTSGYTPGVTTNFTVVSATSIVGTPTVNLPANTGSITWTSAQTATTITVTATVALPVEMVGFTAEALGEDVVLNWQTVSELNNDGFQIQHSTNGSVWMVLDFVKGAGTSDKLNEYEYIHNRPEKGMNYYRLKQLDYAGLHHFTNVLQVELLGDNDRMTLSPNPLKIESGARLHINAGDFKKGKLEIFDINGRIVFAQNIESSMPELTLSHLPKGIYCLTFYSGKRQLTEKLVIQ